MDADSATAIQACIDTLPKTYIPYAAICWSFLITGCNLVLLKWKPPAATSKAAILYGILRFIALSKGYNTPAFQPSASALMLPLSMDKDKVAKKLGLDPVTTDPKYPGTPQYCNCTQETPCTRVGP